ncbi:MAG TPA: response regulator [Actinomycetota bacterium]|nr:response regulator [Actinomycetota bacterium]
MPKILVVEDQQSVVAIVRYHLESAGMEGLFASDVQDGWRLLTAEAPDAVVVDIGLPGADGWTLIEKLRGDERFSALPVVVLTGLIEPQIVQRAASLGCDYLSKPFAASALLGKIRGGLDPGVEAKRPAEPRPDPNKVDLVVVGVVMLLDHYQVEGKVHLPPELARFSDAWESLVRDSRGFVPVTDVRVSLRDGHTVVATPPFMEVRKADVRAVFPQDAPVG